MLETSIEVVPAILPASRDELLALAERVVPFAKTLQLDVVDGVFDDNVTWPYAAGSLDEMADFRLPRLEKIFWEVDLMVKDPREIGNAFIRAGASRIIAHIEAFADTEAARSIFEEWQRAGAQAAVSILLDTPIGAIENVFYDVQVIQVMGIAEIGAQGQPFDARALVRVRELRNAYPQALISVDGGITAAHASALARAGANRLVVGSAIMKASDPRAAYDEIVAAVQTP